MGINRKIFGGALILYKNDIQLYKDGKLSKDRQR